MRLRGAGDAAPEIAVCAIDAKSIDRLGQWPWPRSRVAKLVRALHGAGARAIAFDMVFSEADRGGPQEDAALAAALREAGNAVLGFYATTAEPEPGLPRPAPPAALELVVEPPGGFPAVREWPALEANLPALDAAAPLAGHFTIEPDRDGTIRHYPLIVRHADRFYPALALRAVQVFRGGAPLSLRPYRGHLPSVRVGDLEVPASELGELWVNFRGPAARTFPYYSAADVLDGRVPADAFRDRLVFIGATESGLGDVVTTPFDAVVPGVEVHATVADNLLHARFIRDGAPEIALGILAVLLLGPGAASAAALVRRPLVGAAVAVGGLAAYGIASQLALTSLSRHLPLVLPTFAAAAGYTTAAVWRVLVVEARARQIRSTFARYVSEPVVEELLRDPDRLRLGGEKRELTVLFSDLRGFTGAAERMAPEQVVALLNAFLTPMTRILLAHNGTVDKYMGDAVMAFFGAPVSQPDHPQRACAAALAMRDRARLLGEEWAARGLPRLSAGIGLNTGPMAVGNMGSEEIFDYTVVGDHVNLGARLESATRVWGVDIVASEFTVALAGDGFVFRELDRTQVKGRGEPVRLFELVASAVERAGLEEFLAAYSAGLDAWRRGDLDAARESFDRALRLRPGDGPSALYLERLAAARAANARTDGAAAGKPPAE